MVTFCLLAIGGLNWGLAVFGWDLAHWVTNMTVDKIVYALVGLSALYEIFTHGMRCKECKNEMPAGGMSGGMGSGMGGMNR